MNSIMTTQYDFFESGVFERPRYFPRQLVTPDDLTLNQTYFRDKMRRHNRLLHGWGVVCGAIVCRVPIVTGNGKATLGYRSNKEDPCPMVEDESCLDPWRVSISPGYILGPCGNEILIPCEIVVDVRHACTTGSSSDPCPPPPDPWCSDVIVDRGEGPVYLAARYKEVMTRPVRVQPAGCGCDETACEYSRIRDGFEVCTLTECPESHQNPPTGDFECTLHACFPCPAEPWIVLARIDLDVEGVTQIDNYSCRRMVHTFANYWCRPTVPQPATGDEAQIVGIIEKGVRSIAVNNMDVTEEDLAGEEKLRAAGTHDATELRGITSSSHLGKKLVAEKMTIEKIAAMPHEQFVEFAVKNEPEKRQGQIKNQASDVWRRAREIMEALGTWKRHHQPT